MGERLCSPIETTESDMTEAKPDPTSDAARTDPETADATREKLKKEAEKGLKNASDEARKDGK